jgi:6-methylsalicylate decarboxylase
MENKSFSRKTFLKAALAAGVAGAGYMAYKKKHRIDQIIEGTGIMSDYPIPSGKIDTHHHLIAPAFVKAMVSKGLDKVAGSHFPSEWSMEASLEVMDKNGIQTAITSVSSPGVYFGNLPEAIDLARNCNEYAAEMKQKAPKRFGSFAVLPMPFTEPACKEAIYALDTLKADGIVLMGSSNSVFLGDPSLDELMAELDKRKAVVFVHPNMHPTSDTLKLRAPGFIIEFLCDTTRAAVNLIMTGTVEKYSNIKWILAHGGGFLPYVAWRVALADNAPELTPYAPKGVMHYVKSFYYDTTLAPSHISMASLRELVDPSHIFFGADIPFAPKIMTGVQINALGGNQLWKPEQKDAFYRGNALQLFPHLA